jgi:hypothetical protein
MASQTHISFTNLMKTAVITVFSEASGYPKANLQEPEQLGLPWRSTDTTASWIVIDLGSAVPFDRINLIGANFTSVTIQQNTTDTWGAPPYTQAFTIGRDFDQRLYRLTVASGGNFTRRFTRILIPSQTPVGGATYFELLGIYLGTFTTVPAGIALSPSYRAGRVTPRVSHAAALGGWRVAYESGDPFATPHLSRVAAKSATTPGIGDEYASWLAIDRQIDALPTGVFCAVFAWLGPGAVGMYRQENDSDWQDEGAAQMRDAWDLVEASAG